MNCELYFLILLSVVIGYISAENVLICDGEQRLSQFHIRLLPSVVQERCRIQ